MMNIFLIFDPSNSSFLSLNWSSMLIMTLLLPFSFWCLPSRFTLINFNMLLYLFKEFKILINYSFTNLILFLSLMMMIFYNNFLGLFPYIFTASSHMSFCFSFSLSMWLGMMMYSMYFFLNDLFTHLTPQNTPLILSPFMVIIETISLLIRPFTLAIRLTANMIAGHLLLSLLGSSGIFIPNIFFLMMLITSQILLYILEIAVSIIQAYVYSILSVLYSSEI